MYTRRYIPDLLLLGLISVTNQSPAQTGPDLGQPATPEQVAAWDIDVGADGAGLPPGSGSVEQGSTVYELKCMACHGEAGQGGLNDRLVGGQDTLDDDAVKTIGSFWPFATTIFDYIRRSMPYFEPGALSDYEVYSVTAYLLFLNEIIEADQVINAETLPTIQMPNQINFVRSFP